MSADWIGCEGIVEHARSGIGCAGGWLDPARPVPDRAVLGCGCELIEAPVGQPIGWLACSLPAEPPPPDCLRAEADRRLVQAADAILDDLLR